MRAVRHVLTTRQSTQLVVDFVDTLYERCLTCRREDGGLLRDFVANRNLVVLVEMQCSVVADVECLHNAVSSEIEQIAIRRCEIGGPLYMACC